MKEKRSWTLSVGVQLYAGVEIRERSNHHSYDIYLFTPITWQHKIINTLADLFKHFYKKMHYGLKINSQNSKIYDS